MAIVNDPCCDPRTEHGWDWFPTKPPVGDGCGHNNGGSVIEQPYMADWQMDGKGALAADNQLHSAVVMQLFTDQRVPDDQTTYLDNSLNRGGWWGDYFAPFAMGSKLWTLYRGALTDGAIQDAQRYTREALQPLVEQGAAARLVVYATADKSANYLYIQPVFYAKDGSKLYDQKFSRFWNN